MTDPIRKPRNRHGWVAVLLLLAAPADAEPGAYDLLEEVREAYGNLTSYRDRGEIEIEEAGSKRILTFETFREGDTFRLQVDDGEGFRRVLSRRGDAIRLDDLELGQYRRPASLGAGLVEILGRDDFDALAVATTVAGSPAALSPPGAAAVEGVEPCGQSSCWLLALSRSKGDHETLLWIDRESHLVRRFEISVYAGADSLRQALDEAGLVRDAAALTPPSAPRSFRVRLEIGAANEPRTTPKLADVVPPAGAREVADWEPSTVEPEVRSADAGVRSADAETVPALVFDDAVDVELFTLTTRVVDSRGRPVPDLSPKDFRAVIGGDEILVLSVDWVSSDPAYRDPELERELRRAGVELEPPEKLVVVFVQSDVEPPRIRGHLKTMPYFQDFLDTLQPNDRVGVVAFDSRLTLRLDFTRRHDEVSEAVGEAMRFGSEPRLRRRGQAEPSLARHFDFRAARDAASPEQALTVVARALEPIPGDKVMVYLGWGMGRFGGGGVRMTGDFVPAVEALRRARTSVFVLDVADAAYHSLELGLRGVAAETGGTYDKTSLFPGQAAGRLAGTLTGHYVLTFARADLPAETGILEIALREKKGRVIGDTFRVDRR